MVTMYLTTHCQSPQKGNIMASRIATYLSEKVAKKTAETWQW
jgi:hypothetical protein